MKTFLASVTRNKGFSEEVVGIRGQTSFFLQATRLIQLSIMRNRKKSILHSRMHFIITAVLCVLGKYCLAINMSFYWFTHQKIRWKMFGRCRQKSYSITRKNKLHIAGFSTYWRHGAFSKVVIIFVIIFSVFEGVVSSNKKRKSRQALKAIKN